MINKDLISYILSNSGKLPENETWYEVGIKFRVESPNPKKAKENKKYKKKSIATKANDIWRKYAKQKNNLELSKEIYDGKGNLKFETYKKPAIQKHEYDPEEFEIEKVTTNPHGGAWIKMKKKERLYEEEHLKELKEMLTQEIKPVIKPTVSSDTQSALFIYGSDKHIGALTKEDSVYKNKYDRKEMRRRIVNLTIKEILEWKSQFGILEDLYIMDFGDALDGFNQKTTGGLRGTSSHILPQQLNNREQHDFYVELHKELFDIIVKEGYAENIYFVATSNSNHGGDFEYGAMRNLETYLEVKYPFIKTCVSYKPFNHFIYGDHCIVFGHGKDDEDMKNGFPLTLNDKVENVLADYIRVNKLEDYNVTVISGDLHQSATTHAKNFRYKKVLSQYGSSKWMHTNFGSGSPGLSSEILLKHSSRIYSSDTFFDIENESNTGISF